MEISLADLIDRYTILKLKLERLNLEQKKFEPLLEKEFLAYEKAIDNYRMKGVSVKQDWIDQLHKINGNCWDLEADIRQGKEGILGLEEVGRRAILIRDINRQRIAVKNLVAKETGLGFLEIKTNHASTDDVDNIV
ncbi:MAG: hypothetical protein HYY86_00905 [Candidatus Harrisonbacteria bacterium]|nr:hypothetical protein [Candidatus Harrisonbacteria bacterium]